jgi:hypothetical protein
MSLLCIETEISRPLAARHHLNASVTDSASDFTPHPGSSSAPQSPIIPEIVWINPPIKEVLANI